jgi:hypothetical protein
MSKKMCVTVTSLALLLCLFGFCYAFSLLWSAPASAQQFDERARGMMPPMRGGGEVAIAMDQTHIYVATAKAVYKINKATFTIEKTLDLPNSEPQRMERPFKKKPAEEE